MTGSLMRFHDLHWPTVTTREGRCSDPLVTVLNIYSMYSTSAFTIRDPIGVCGYISTWSFSLHTICTVPDILRDVLLGYGSSDGAKYYRLSDGAWERVLDLNDTFLDAVHVPETFPGRKIIFQGIPAGSAPHPPFWVKFDAFEPPLDFA
eukprot:998639_1